MASTGGAPGELVVLDDAAALASQAADRVCGWASAAIAARGVAHVALTGGSSAGALYGELRSTVRRSSVDWSRLHLWWGDERYVPLDHRDSNAGLAVRLLFDPGLVEEVDRSEVLPIPARQVHPVPVDEAIGHARGPAWAAQRYAEMLGETMPATDDGTPVFDVVLLGMGSDGHILSVFPDSAALDDTAPLAMAVPSPTHIEPHLERITLHPRILEPAANVLVMVPGRGKATIVRDVLRAGGGGAWPAGLALRPNATWLLDRDSASELD